MSMSFKNSWSKRRGFVLALNLLLSVAVMAAATGTSQEAQATNANYGFQTVAKTLEYGQNVVAVIIDMGADVPASAINIGTFSVSTTNLRQNLTTVAYSGPRTVVNAYVNNTKELGEHADNGRYIVLELLYGYTVPGATTLYYVTYNYLLVMNYQVTQNISFPFTDATIVDPAATTYTKVGEINLVADSFAKLGQGSLNYRLFTPADTTKAQPLVLFLHGSGEGGTGNNESQLRANMGATAWAEPDFQKRHRSYVMAPQTGGSWSNTNLDLSYTVIQGLIDAGKVDSRRVYLVGLSSGGGGALTMLSRHLTMFAAALINCPASTVTVAQAATFASTYQHIWLVQALNDPTVNPANTTLSYNRMLAAGVDVYYTTFPDVHTDLGTYSGHWSWVYTYNNFVDPGPQQRGPVMDWLFGSPCCFQLTTAVSPSASAGTITPASAVLRNGDVVSVAATANAGYIFAGFSGALTGITTPQNLTVRGDANVVANFTPVAPALNATVGARSDGGGTRLAPITLTNTGQGAATNATISSVTASVTSGSGSVSVSSGVPVNVGTIATGASSTPAVVVFSWPATAIRVALTIKFTADGGYSGASTVTVFR